MKLYLVRHGRTDWNNKSRIQGSSDIPLNDTGKRQSRVLGEEIRNRHLMVRSIYTSRLARARETAELLSEKLGCPCFIEAGLEEMRFGEWEGMSWRQVREEDSERYLQWNDDRYGRRIPGGESYRDLLERLVPTLLHITEKERDTYGSGTRGSVLVVTHSACIMTLLSWLHDTPFEDMAKNYHMKNTGIYVLEETELRRHWNEKTLE